MELEIRDQIELNTYCYSIPKIDLHAHLNGSIRKTTLFELSTPEDQEKLSLLYSKPITLNSAFEIFKISSKILTSLEVVSRITREMIEDWNKQNTMYLEIRTTLKSIAGKKKEDYLEAVLSEIEKGNKKHSLQTRLIMSLNREYPIADYLETFETYKNYKNENLKKLIVGIDYCGNEQKELHKIADVIPIFQKFRDEGLMVTIHSGESENYQHFDFKAFRPDRISHTYFYTDEEYLDVMKNKIPIEICPTGSYCVKELNSYFDITFNKYHNKKIQMENGVEYNYDLYCINTDDTMLFNSDLLQEYFEVASHFHLTKQDIKEMLLRSTDFIFEKDEDFRQQLRNKLKNY